MRVSKPLRNELDYVNTRSTEEGYSDALRRAVLTAEAQDRNKTYEVAHVFDSQGNQTAVRVGDNKQHGKAHRSVSLAGVDLEDKILTHNHPNQKNMVKLGGFANIGQAHSGPDLRVSIDNNAREVRAVTGTYTFSVKRPAGGWNANGRDVENYWNAEYRKATSELRALGRNIENRYYSGKITMAQAQKEIDTLNARAYATLTHTATKNTAKHFGFRYSKKKG